MREELGGLCILGVFPARLVAAYGFIKLKRWGYRWMIITSWAYMMLWLGYMVPARPGPPADPPIPETEIRMHYEFQPADAPDPDDPDVVFGVAPQQITTELLALCEEFFRQASPIVHGELRQFLTDRGHPGGLGWFIDALGFTTANCEATA